MQNKEILEYIQHAFELKEQKCYKQAIEMLYKALETESDNIEVLFQIGELYFLMGNSQRAIQYLEKVLLKNPTHSDSLALLKKIYISLNMYDEAFRYAENIFAQHNTAKNLAELIKLSGKLNKFDKIEDYSKSELFDDNQVQCALAGVYYEHGDIAKAKEILGKINDNDEAAILLGKINFDENNFDVAKEIFSRLPLNYENAEVLNYRGLFYLEDMNFIEAIKSFSKALNLDKQNARYAYNLGNAYFYNGWMKEAVKSYLDAVCLAPEIMDYRYSLAYLYYTTGAYEKTQREVDYILENDPVHNRAITLNALLKFKKKDFLGAKNDLEKVLANKEDDFAVTSLVKVYCELQMFEKAEQLLKPLLEKYPDKAQYKYDLAEILYAQKKDTEALAILRQVIEKEENYLPAYSLAAACAFSINDYAAAKEYAQRSISIDINFAPGYYYLALVRKAEKDYDEAIECMKRAVMYDLNNAEYYAEMSKIYQQKDDIKTALEYANEASSIDNSTKYKVLYSELAALNRKRSNDEKLSSKKITL